MKALGVDTSNYATSLAVVDLHREEVVCAKKRFLTVKEGELGLRQSDAVFHHTVALPALLAQMREEGVLNGIGAVGVSARPRPEEGSYMPCFLAGVSFASAFAAGAGVPLRQVSHQEGHLRAALFGARNVFCPGSGEELLFFHVSGGTTELLLARGFQLEKTLGGSLDLFAGQAVDRLGVKLGSTFPAGPAVSALAAECGEEIKPKISADGCNCHLSGLQNTCERLLAEGRPPAYAAKYCLLAVADTMAAMVQNARQARGNLPLLCAGGVLASATVKDRLAARLSDVFFAPPEYAADNAVGVAILGGKTGGAAREP